MCRGDPPYPGGEEAVSVVAVWQRKQIVSGGHSAGGAREVVGSILYGELAVAFDKGFH